jgi:hypothetical protein
VESGKLFFEFHFPFFIFNFQLNLKRFLKKEPIFAVSTHLQQGMTEDFALPLRIIEGVNARLDRIPSID